MSITTRAMEADSLPPQPSRHSGARLAWPDGIDPGKALADTRVPIMLISGAERAVSVNESCIELAHAHGLAIDAMSNALQEAGRVRHFNRVTPRGCPGWRSGSGWAP